MRRSDYAAEAAALASALIGRILVRELPGGERLGGVIVETEAYLGVIDRASHAFGGRRTARTEPMYGQPGTSYVYFTYGMHHCFNIVCGSEGEPAVVLIRAVQPLFGAERMREHREATRASSAKALRDVDLCSGPARLCQAMAIDLGLNRADLTRDPRLFVCEPCENLGKKAIGRIVRTSRIGVAYAGEWAGKPLRFVLEGNPHVSVPVGRARGTSSGAERRA